MISVLRSGIVGVLACVALSAQAGNAPFAPSEKELPALPMQTTSTVLGNEKMYGGMTYMSTYSSTITAAGAESPYDNPSETSGIRRVSPGGGIGEPGAIEPTPIGDVPVVAMLLALGVYAMWKKRRQKVRN